jgi:hypothetical protein
MQQVFERLWVANDRACRAGGVGWSVVHACKSPCHQRAAGYRGSLPSSHPNYLFLREERDLYLNLIDPPRPLFMPASFVAFLEFADGEWTAGQNLLIHCNQGESRAPSLALLFLAKRRGALDDSSYATARTAFEGIFLGYKPGTGIASYFSTNWQKWSTNAA